MAYLRLHLVLYVWKYQLRRKSPSRHSVWYSEQPVFLHCSIEFRWHSLSDRLPSLVRKFFPALRYKRMSRLSDPHRGWYPMWRHPSFLLFSTCWCWCHTSVRSVSGLSGTLLLSVGRSSRFCHAIPTAGLARYNFRLLRSLLYLPCQLRCRLSRSTGWQWCEPDKWKWIVYQLPGIPLRYRRNTSFSWLRCLLQDWYPCKRMP